MQQTNRPTDRQTDRPTGRRTSRPTDQPTSRPSSSRLEAGLLEHGPERALLPAEARVDGAAEELAVDEQLRERVDARRLGERSTVTVAAVASGKLERVDVDDLGAVARSGRCS